MLMHWLKSQRAESSFSVQDEAVLKRVSTTLDEITLKKLDSHLSTTTSTAYILINEDHRVRWFNRAAAQAFGLKQEDIQRPLPHLIRAPSLPDFLRSSNTQSSIEYGKFRFRLNRTPFLLSDMLLQLEPEEDREHLLRLQSEFLGAVAHELNTPITVINGFLELLEQEPESQEAQKMIQRLRQQTARLSGLSSQLLQLIRAQQSPARHLAIDAVSFFDHLQSETAALPTAQRTISWTIDTNIDLYGDRTALHSAFRNIIDNAIRYTSPEQGHITIRWYKIVDKHVFEVSDNGIGIPQEYIPRLGERFFRAGQPSSTGTGLGLSIVKHVAKQHDADVNVQSKPHQGSTFSILFRNIT